MAIREFQVDLEDIPAKLFGSVSRARILHFLLANTGMSFYQQEIMFETVFSLQPTQRELKILVDLGIVNKKESRSRVYYEINPQSSLFRPLSEIFKVKDPC